MRAQGAGSRAKWQGRFVEVLPPEAMVELPRQTLVFGWAVEEQRTLASERRFFAAVTGISVVSSPSRRASRRPRSTSCAASTCSC
ncbi:MAG: hypothetical protein HY901_33295 [Deltaproteobacteria bacterium]|nr:hypothetical protein [Deltaproteobacteria bacterium]